MKIKKLRLVKTTIKNLKVKTEIQTGWTTSKPTTTTRVTTEDTTAC